MESRLKLSGERLSAVYHLAGDREEVSARAWDICLEQTVEYPEDLIHRRDIREQVFGQVESIASLDENLYEVVIGFAIETVGDELTGLLNVLFGNISLKPGIRLAGFRLPANLAGKFKGPRFGRQGLRDLTGVSRGPILCSAIKPMGLSANELADLSYQFALGGIDLIKDDHGIADQRFCRFDERVKRCAEAVRRANRETGGSSLYVPNVSGPSDKMAERVQTARKAGAQGLLIAPGLTGFDVMRHIAEDDSVALPILSHPALLGSFTVRPTEGI
jgi:ribulose-bisphosphate carboxylase large chain